jgi:hypothetical protein
MGHDRGLFVLKHKYIIRQYGISSGIGYKIYIMAFQIINFNVLHRDCVRNFGLWDVNRLFIRNRKFYSHSVSIVSLRI